MEEKIKETREEKKARKQKEHLKKAECIKKYQAEALRFKEYIKANKDKLTDDEIDALKEKYKKSRGLAFELKHPVLNGVKNLMSALFELYIQMMDVENEVFMLKYGIKDCTVEDAQRVALTNEQFGPVAAEKVKSEIEEEKKAETKEDELGD